MRARNHVLFGAVVSTALIPVFGPYSAVFFGASVLVDADHYVDYVYRNRFQDFSIRRMFIFHEYLFRNGNSDNFLSLNLGHTAEALLICYIGSLVTGWAWMQAIFWGMLFHWLTDAVSLVSQGRLFQRALSLLEYIIRWNRMKRRGRNPSGIYELAFLEALGRFDKSANKPQSR